MPIEFCAAGSLGKRLIESEGNMTKDGSQVFLFSVAFLELLGRRACDLVAVGQNSNTDGEPARVEIAIRENKVILVSIHTFNVNEPDLTYARSLVKLFLMSILL